MTSGGVDWPDFVDKMNDHAVDVGLNGHELRNPNGFDDAPTHYTTAQELTENPARLEAIRTSPRSSVSTGRGTDHTGPERPEDVRPRLRQELPGLGGREERHDDELQRPGNGCMS